MPLARAAEARRGHVLRGAPYVWVEARHRRCDHGMNVGATGPSGAQAATRVRFTEPQRRQFFLGTFERGWVGSVAAAAHRGGRQGRVRGEGPREGGAWWPMANGRRRHDDDDVGGTDAQVHVVGAASAAAAGDTCRGWRRRRRREGGAGGRVCGNAAGKAGAAVRAAVHDGWLTGGVTDRGIALVVCSRSRCSSGTRACLRIVAEWSGVRCGARAGMFFEASKGVDAVSYCCGCGRCNYEEMTRVRPRSGPKRRLNEIAC